MCDGPEKEASTFSLSLLLACTHACMRTATAATAAAAVAAAAAATVAVVASAADAIATAAVPAPACCAVQRYSSVWYGNRFF